MAYRHVAAAVRVVLTAALLTAPSCRRQGPPDEPAVVSGPQDGRTNIVYEFAVTTTHPGGEEVSIRLDWGDRVSDWSAFVPSGDTLKMSHAWAAAGSYWVEAQARDKSEAESEWSGPHRVTITVNRPPDTPGVPNGASTTPKDSVCAFSARTTDPDGDSVAYRFDWGDGDTSGWTDRGPSGSAGTGAHSWRSDGTYQIRVQAKDGYEALSGWSSPRSVSVSDIRWRYHTDGIIHSSPAIAPDGTVYFGSYDRYLYALNPDGTLRWRYQTGSVVASSPAIAPDGTVYIGSWDHCLHALNPDGTFRWRYETGHLVNSSPAITSDGTVHFGSADGGLYALGPDGTLRWRYQIRKGITSSPAIAPDGTVYFGADDSCLYAHRAASPLASSPWPKYRHDSRNTGSAGGGLR
jgi:hypothetical protein